MSSVGNLASVLQNKGLYKISEKMKRRALKWFEKVLRVVGRTELPDDLDFYLNIAMLLKGVKPQSC